MTIQFAYVPYACISEFLEGEQGNTSTFVEWNVVVTCSVVTFGVNLSQP